MPWIVELYVAVDESIVELLEMVLIIVSDIVILIVIVMVVVVGIIDIPNTFWYNQINNHLSTCVIELYHKFQIN